MEAAVTTELYIWEYLLLWLEAGTLWVVKLIDGNKVIVAKVLNGEEFTMNQDEAKMRRMDLKRNLIKQALQLLWDLPDWYTMSLSITKPTGSTVFSEAYTWWTPDRISNN